MKGSEKIVRFIYVCNSGSDDISVIEAKSLKEVKRINIGANFTRVGPHGVCRYKNNIITANSYNNTLSLIKLNSNEVDKSFYIGSNCNDVRTVKDNAYTICGDLNSVIRYDLENEIIDGIIPCGYMPHSIDFSSENKFFAVSNMMSSNVTIFSENSEENIENIRVGEYPAKAIFSPDGKYIIVCESNIGTDYNGSVNILSLKDKVSLATIKVGKWPIDAFCNANFIFVSNFGDGTVSVISLKNFKEIERIRVGSMVRGVVEHEGKLYISDNYNGVLIYFNLGNNTKKIIPIGKEPTGILFN